MANTLTNAWNPIFYAQESLIVLHKAFGMAGRVHRGYENERGRAYNVGDTISIRKPQTFAAANAPATATNLAPQTVNITLNKWKEVKFAMTDKDLTLAPQQIIAEHITPAAYALADDVDQSLCALTEDIPWFYDLSSGTTPTVSDIIGPRKVLFDNQVPIADTPNMHYMIDSSLEAGFLALSAFSQNQGAGDAGVSTQMRGSLGVKYGLEVFAAQNVSSHAKGSCNDTALKLNDAAVAGATTINLTAVDGGVTGTLVAGDSFVIAGNTQRYVVTALNTAGTNVFTSVPIFPALVQDYPDDAAVTVRLVDKKNNVAFHRNAFALAMAPLSEQGNQLGAKIATVTNPVTGISIRSRLFYIGDSSQVVVALDILYGVKTLDPNLAVRCMY